MTIKKISAILMLSVLPLGALMAQDTKNYLPKAGDYAIGIDMQPVYSFFGNMANGTAAVANGLNTFGGEEALNYTNNVTIMGKYMLDNTTALRVNFGIRKDVNHDFQYSRDDYQYFINPLSEAKVEDGAKFNGAYYSIAVGMEFRRGKERIQGYYGADLVFGKSKEKFDFTYGNAVTEANQSPSRNFNVAGTPYSVAIGANPPTAVVAAADPTYFTTSYITESFRKAVEIGVAGRVGVEYFVVPKLSFGGEVSLLISETFDRGSYVITEGYNFINGKVENHTEMVSPKAHRLHIGTEDLGGKLFMMFYF